MQRCSCRARRRAAAAPAPPGATRPAERRPCIRQRTVTRVAAVVRHVQCFEPDDPRRRKCDATGDRVLELTHVAGPWLSLEMFDELGRELDDVAKPVALAVLARELARERRDVRLAFAQRWHDELDHVEPVVLELVRELGRQQLHAPAPTLGVDERRLAQPREACCLGPLDLEQLCDAAPDRPRREDHGPAREQRNLARREVRRRPGRKQQHEQRPDRQHPEHDIAPPRPNHRPRDRDRNCHERQQRAHQPAGRSGGEERAGAHRKDRPERRGLVNELSGRRRDQVRDREDQRRDREREHPHQAGTADRGQHDLARGERQDQPDPCEPLSAGDGALGCHFDRGDSKHLASADPHPIHDLQPWRPAPAGFPAAPRPRAPRWSDMRPLGSALRPLYAVAAPSRSSRMRS